MISAKIHFLIFCSSSLWAMFFFCSFLLHYSVFKRFLKIMESFSVNIAGPFPPSFLLGLKRSFGFSDFVVLFVFQDPEFPFFFFPHYHHPIMSRYFFLPFLPFFLPLKLPVLLTHNFPLLNRACPIPCFLCHLLL